MAAAGQPARTILELIGRLHEQSGVTVVIVTHDHALDGIGTRDLLVEDGRVRDAEPAS